MFTQGEWHVPIWTRRDSDNRCWVMRGKTSICTCFGKPKTAEGNARLIAAAPDLLNLLKDMLHEYQEDTTEKGVMLDLYFQRKIESAIEKAEKGV